MSACHVVPHTWGALDWRQSVTATARCVKGQAQGVCVWGGGGAVYPVLPAHLNALPPPHTLAPAFSVALLRMDSTVVAPHRYWDSQWKTFYMIDPQNFTGTPAQLQRMLGGHVCVWDDAANSDGSNMVQVTYPPASAVAEVLWSPKEESIGA